MYGATLVDVAEVYNESIKTTTITLTARSLGAIFSSLIGFFRNRIPYLNFGIADGVDTVHKRSDWEEA